MISAKFLWGNVLLGGKLQIGAKNSNFEIFESALYMKSVSMPLIKFLEINSFSNIYLTCYEVGLQFKCEFLIIVCEVYMLISIINQLIF